jgi:hypothetical protein
MENNDNPLAEDLFGKVRKAPRVGNLPPPMDKLAAEVTDPGCSTWMFCSECGGVYPVLTDAIRQIVPDAPADMTGRYIQVEGCDWCGPGLHGAHVEELTRS